MGTMLVGMLIVAVGAGGFGYALFGRRPTPQTAMQAGGVTVHGGRAADRRTAADLDRLRRTDDAVLSGWSRIRAALLLALTVVGLAALIGATVSIAVVGLVLLAT